MSPDILQEEKYRVALERLVREEAVKFDDLTTGQRWLERVKQFVCSSCLAVSAGAAVGAFHGGLEGCIDAVKNVSIGILPYIALYHVAGGYVNERFYRKIENYAVKTTKGIIKNCMGYVKNKKYILGGTLIKCLASSAIFWYLSLLTEKITGANIGRSQMWEIGALAGLVASGTHYYQGKKWTKKIIDYAEEHLPEKEPINMELEDLENLVDFALDNKDKVQKIGLLTNRQFLSSEPLDPTRFIPNIALGFGGQGFWNPEYPVFKFECEKKTRKDTILKLLKAAKDNSKGLKLEISHLSDPVPLDEYLSDPYEYFSIMWFKAKRGEKTYFEVEYSDLRGIEVKIPSRKHLHLFKDIFEKVNDRPLQDTDFDQEIIEHYKKAEPQVHKFKPKKEQEHKSTFELLAELKQEADKHEKAEPEPYEKPLEDVDSLADAVFSIYNNEKHDDDLNIAFQGLLYTLKQEEHDKSRLAKYFDCASRILCSPIKTVRSLIAEKEIRPSLKDVWVRAQIPGITRENIYDIIRELEKHIPDMKVDFRTDEFDYIDFCRLQKNPKSIIERTRHVQLVGEHGVIHLYFDEPKKSFKTIREGLGEDIGSYFTSVYKKVTGKQSYEHVKEQEGMPAHTLIYNEGLASIFNENRNVLVCNSKGLFQNKPVHPKQGIRAMTKYISLLREAVEKVNS